MRRASGACVRLVVWIRPGALLHRAPHRQFAQQSARTLSLGIQIWRTLRFSGFDFALDLMSGVASRCDRGQPDRRANLGTRIFAQIPTLERHFSSVISHVRHFLGRPWPNHFINLWKRTRKADPQTYDTCSASDRHSVCTRRASSSIATAIWNVLEERALKDAPEGMPQVVNILGVGAFRARMSTMRASIRMWASNQTSQVPNAVELSRLKLSVSFPCEVLPPSVADGPSQPKGCAEKVHLCLLSILAWPYSADSDDILCDSSFFAGLDFGAVRLGMALMGTSCDYSVSLGHATRFLTPAAS